MSIDKDNMDELFLRDDFEVTYEEDIPTFQSDLNTDAYKDVLSVLSELDDTHSFDYLEANRTKTIRIDEIREHTNTTKNPITKIIDSYKKWLAKR